ncbi:MAG: UDP-N-acetylmuramoyl-L-alanine--D-glutamate ligase [Saprospiraceae bacterium]
MSSTKRIVILGAGESGTGAALLAKALGYAVFVSDKSPIKPQYQAVLENAGIEFETGQHSLDKITNATEVVKSPGIPAKTDVMKAIRSKGLPVIGEIEFGYRHAGKCTIVAITGSNGKTTTTLLIHHLLKTAGMNVRVGGNVGNSFAELVLENRGKENLVYVLEVSSFQLEDIRSFRPKVAVLLNITPDHLDRYDYQMENYARAKFRINQNQKRGDVFIFNAADPVVVDYMTRHPLTAAKQVPVRRGFFKNGSIHIGKRHTFDMTGSKLRGPHNMFNATCAIRTALSLGANPAQIQSGLNTFEPPPHRLEVVATANGVTWINDSKATNVDSVFYALQAMTTPTIWIVGGQDKGNDYTPLLPLVKKKVKAIVCLGVDNSKIIAFFKKTKKPIVETRSAEEAVQQAARLAAHGDTVLLSPACASFDLFKNYEDRGEQFRAGVEKVSQRLMEFFGGSQRKKQK